MSFLATTSGVSGEDVRDLMVAAVEHRFGRVTRLPVTIEWLSDNGSCYLASDWRGSRFEADAASEAACLESPQSNGMAEAFVGSGGRPIRLLGRSRMRSMRLERETPITSATVFIANRPSAATAAAAAVFLIPWRVRPPP
jgi:transposase InsO family protein